MRTRSVGKEKGAKGATDHAEAARAAQEAIRKDPASPENYSMLAASLRMHARSLRERNAEGADYLLHLACAAAWEAKRRSGQGLISGRTKQEVKILIAWVRTRNHLTPEASEIFMDRIHSEYFDRVLEGLDALQGS